MKKLVLGFAFILVALSMNAQSISENALGLRLGDNNGFGGEIS